MPSTIAAPSLPSHVPGRPPQSLMSLAPRPASRRRLAPLWTRTLHHRVRDVDDRVDAFSSSWSAWSSAAPSRSSAFCTACLSPSASRLTAVVALSTPCGSRPGNAPELGERREQDIADREERRANRLDGRIDGLACEFDRRHRQFLRALDHRLDRAPAGVDRRRDRFLDPSNAAFAFEAAQPRTRRLVLGLLLGVGGFLLALLLFLVGLACPPRCAAWPPCWPLLPRLDLAMPSTPSGPPAVSHWRRACRSRLPLRVRCTCFGVRSLARSGLVGVRLALELVELRVRLGTHAALARVPARSVPTSALAFESAASISTPCCSWATMPTSSEALAKDGITAAGGTAGIPARRRRGQLLGGAVASIWSSPIGSRCPRGPGSPPLRSSPRTPRESRSALAFASPFMASRALARRRSTPPQPLSGSGRPSSPSGGSPRPTSWRPGLPARSRRRDDQTRAPRAEPRRDRARHLVITSWAVLCCSTAAPCVASCQPRRREPPP